MPQSKARADDIDWSLTTWEGARREQLRRWAALPLERVILAIGEMGELADWSLHAQERGSINDQ